LIFRLKFHRDDAQTQQGRQYTTKRSLITTEKKKKKTVSSCVRVGSPSRQHSSLFFFFFFFFLFDSFMLIMLSPLLSFFSTDNFESPISVLFVFFYFFFFWLLWLLFSGLTGGRIIKLLRTADGIRAHNHRSSDAQTTKDVNILEELEPPPPFCQRYIFIKESQKIRNKNSTQKLF
jgi:hypothetical protein